MVNFRHTFLASPKSHIHNDVFICGDHSHKAWDLSFMVNKCSRNVYAHTKTPFHTPDKSGIQLLHTKNTAQISLKFSILELKWSKMKKNIHYKWNIFQWLLLFIMKVTFFLKLPYIMKWNTFFFSIPHFFKE